MAGNVWNHSQPTPHLGRMYVRMASDTRVTSPKTLYKKHAAGCRWDSYQWPPLHEQHTQVNTGSLT